MVGGREHAPSGADEIVRLVPLFALVVAILAVAVDRGSAIDYVLAAVPVAAFCVWSYVPAAPLALVSVAVLVPVVAAQRSGHLEPLMFELSLLAFVVGRWSKSLATAVALGLLTAAAPVVVSVVQEPAEINVGIWMLAVAFPWAVGRAVARQAQLAAQLDETRRELDRQALLSERRRIARDVHDFVGHGLAAMMLQVTSARHVLRRDPAAAEEALRSAEDVGRRSMQELRRTVSLLRSDEDGAVDPLPAATEIPTLVEHARGRPRRRAGSSGRSLAGVRRQRRRRSTASPRRRSPMRHATRRRRGPCSESSSRTGRCDSSPTRSGPAPRRLTVRATG
jgi:signal transduction histidine kinase